MKKFVNFDFFEMMIGVVSMLIFDIVVYFTIFNKIPSNIILIALVIEIIIVLFFVIIIVINKKYFLLMYKYDDNKISLYIPNEAVKVIYIEDIVSYSTSIVGKYKKITIFYNNGNIILPYDKKIVKAINNKIKVRFFNQHLI